MIALAIYFSYAGSRAKFTQCVRLLDSVEGEFVRGFGSHTLTL